MLSRKPSLVGRGRRDGFLSDLDTSTPVVILKLDPNVFHHGGLGVIRTLGRLRVPVHIVHEDALAPLSQRTRWTFGTLQAIWKHRDLLFRPRYGLLGWYVLPQYAVTIILPIVFMPFIVFMGIRAAQVQGIHVLLYYFLLFMAAHLIIASVGIVLMREKWRHLLILPVYRIVFEPLRGHICSTRRFIWLYEAYVPDGTRLRARDGWTPV